MNTAKDAPAVRVDKNFEMPSVPVVLMKILQLVDDDRTSARRFEELILHDPSLSARILKLANSAFYSFRSEVKTISHAIALLGLNLVKSLAIGVSIFESFTKGMREEVDQITNLWMHSFGVGLIAQEIQTRRTTRVEAEFAFLCGLLHDIGAAVFFKQAPRRYCEVFSRDRSGFDADLCSHEAKEFGLDHATMGSMLAKHWNLPPDLATVARYHHDSVSSRLPMVWAVTLADNLARQVGIGFDGDTSPYPLLDQIREQARLDQAEWDQLAARAENQKRDAEEFFKATSWGAEK
jgi:HD-like signal output (HDOD) protein